MLELRPSQLNEITQFVSMEQADDTQAFILPYPPDQHRAEMSKDNVIYLSVYLKSQLIGFMMLVTEASGDVEFRRIVINVKGQGLGQQAIELMEQYCQNELNSQRIWLDVFSTNQRGQHIYQKLGYQHVATDSHQGRPLLLFEKRIESENTEVQQVHQ